MREDRQTKEVKKKTKNTTTKNRGLDGQIDREYQRASR